jgi:hypothetical protein
MSLINILENMSEEYGDYPTFAGDTYRAARTQIGLALTQSPDLPVFVGSFETHNDDRLVRAKDAFTSDLNESPAMAAAVTHIAALQAAVDLVGKENVVLDVELNEKLLNDFKKSPSVSDPATETMWHVVKYALDHGIKINASDILNGSPKALIDQDRFDAELTSVQLQALRTRDAPRIVVHVGGAAHMGNFQGFQLSELQSDGSSLDRTQRVSPLEGIYGAQIFLHTPSTRAGEWRQNPWGDYADNPANATQIDSPGRMSETDRGCLGQYVSDASKAVQAVVTTQNNACSPTAVAQVQSLK